MIENKIKEIQEYFKEKILKWEFEILETDLTRSIVLQIDEKYVFTFWFNEELETCSQNVDIFYKNYIDLEIDFWENRKYFQNFKNFWYIKKSMDLEKKQKFEQYEKLKKELGL